MTWASYLLGELCFHGKLVCKHLETCSRGMATHSRFLSPALMDWSRCFKVGVGVIDSHLRCFLRKYMGF